MQPNDHQGPQAAASEIHVVVDANALITACKFAVDQDLVIDCLSQACSIHIPESVANEATQNLRHPDARVADQRVKDGAIQVESPQASAPAFLDAYRLGRGEVDAIRLFLSNAASYEYEAVVTDDLRAYLVCSRMGFPVRILPDLVLDLLRQGRLTKRHATGIIEATSSRYSEGVMAHSRAQLEEVSADDDDTEDPAAGDR